MPQCPFKPPEVPLSWIFDCKTLKLLAYIHIGVPQGSILSPMQSFGHVTLPKTITFTYEITARAFIFYND